MKKEITDHFPKESEVLAHLLMVWKVAMVVNDPQRGQNNDTAEEITKLRWRIRKNTGSLTMENSWPNFFLNLSGNK